MKAITIITALIFLQYFGLIFKNGENEMRWKDNTTFYYSSYTGKQEVLSLRFTFKYNDLDEIPLYGTDIINLTNRTLTDSTFYTTKDNIIFIRLSDKVEQRFNGKVWAYNNTEWEKLIKFLKTNKF